MQAKMSITPAKLMPRHIKRFYNGCIIPHDYFTFQNSSSQVYKCVVKSSTMSLHLKFNISKAWHKCRLQFLSGRLYKRFRNDDIVNCKIEHFWNRFNLYFVDLHTFFRFSDPVNSVPDNICVLCGLHSSPTRFSF